MLGERVRLADLLAAVSVATRRMGIGEADLSDGYYTALLRHLGCTATAHEEADLGGDELVSCPRPSGPTRESP
jgi:hypothetical protein